MKNFTFYLIFLLCVLLTYGQQSISFESSEGFVLGELNGQNYWTVTGCGDGCFVENQAISNAQATDGDFSLRISQDPDFTAGQQVFGGFYNSPTIIDYRTAILSFDIFIDTEGFSDFRFGAVGPDEEGGLLFTFLIITCDER